jgi:hypothetical protein
MTFYTTEDLEEIHNTLCVCYSLQENEAIKRFIDEIKKGEMIK